MKEKIASFDTFRFILALCVVLGHTCEGLYLNAAKTVLHTLAVDGFFILSGFLIASSVLRQIGLYTDNNTFFITATKRRFCRLWPEYLFALLLVFFLETVYLQKHNGVLLPLNLIMISYINRVPGIVNGSWYICVLFFVGAFVQYLLICKRKQAVYFWFPLIIFFSLSYIYGEYGNLAQTSKPLILGAFSTGLLRGLMDVTIGIECCFASRYITQTDFHFRPWAKKVLPFVWEILGLCLMLYAWFHKGSNRYNFLVLFGYAIVIIVLAQKKEFFLRFLSWKGWKCITPTAYMLFLTHVIWLKIIYRHIPYQLYPHWFVYLAVLVFCVSFGWIWYNVQKYCFAKLKKALFLPAKTSIDNI